MLAVAGPLLVAVRLRRSLLRQLAADPLARYVAGPTYARRRRRMGFVNLTAALLAVVGGWGWYVRQAAVVPWDGEPTLAPFAELLVPLPYFLTLVGCWLVHFDAERALHRAGPFAGGRGFWSRGGYVLHQARQTALLVGLPVGLFATQQAVGRFAPETAQSDGYKLASLAVMPLVIVFLPLVVKPLLGLKPLPPGPARDRLEALSRRLGFRYTDLLLWPTHGATANALIVGVLPRVRYVVVTDRLLDDLPPDELDAVFGHEVGHAAHGHIGYYAVFLALSLSVLAAGFVGLGQAADRAGVTVPPHLAGWLALPPVLAVIGYVFVVFGYLSRRCERQADVYGCRAVSCLNPRCDGHDAATVYPTGGAGLCRAGVFTFIRALERVGAVNGLLAPPAAGGRVRGLAKALGGWLRAWQHGTPAARVRFLHRLTADPGVEPRFQWRVAVLRWGLFLGLTTALMLLGEAVGWRELLAAL